MLTGGSLDERAAARHAVGNLATHAQTDEKWVGAAIEAAMRNAIDRGWTDVRLALMHAQVLFALSHDQFDDAALLADELDSQAEEHGMKAMRAVAMIDKISIEGLRGRQAPYTLYASARILLSDPTQPPRDRLSGLINLALELDVIGIYDIADATLQDAALVAETIEDGAEPVAVITQNRANALLRRAISMIIADDRAGASALFARHEAVVADMDRSFLPAAWSNRHDAHARLVEILLDDSEMSTAEADRHARGLAEADADYACLLQLVTPHGEWTGRPDLSAMRDSQRFEVALYLHVRACRRARITGAEHVEALEHYNAALMQKHRRIRAEVDAGVLAMISAEILTAEREELVEQTLTDDLTGLGNRRAFQRLLDGSIGRPATLILFDLDDFKAINDAFGHQVGDVVLQTTAEVLAASAARLAPEIVARIGGDELAVVLSGEQHARARQIEEMFNAGMAAADWPPQLSSVPTATFGVASLADRAALFGLADQDLYQNKRRLKHTG